MQKKPTAASKSGYAVLLPFLQKQGRTVERALGDGNCLFRSLSLQLTGTQDHHIKLRKVIAKFEQTEGVFEKLHKTINRTPFLSHLQKIKKTCVWGTNVEVMATASLFQIDVYVATESHNPTWLRYTPATSAQTTSKLLSDISPHLQPQKEWIEIVRACVRVIINLCAYLVLSTSTFSWTCLILDIIMATKLFI